MQLKQDKDDVLQYAAKFESLKDQLETYDEQTLVMKFIFGLKAELIEHVLLQYPKTVQEAKQIAEELDIVHQGVKRHENKTALEQNQTSNKKQGKKGILGNVSVKRGQQYQYQNTGIRTRSRQTRSRHASISCNISRSVNQKSVQNSLLSRRSVQRGTNFESSTEIKSAAAKWRDIIRPLSHRDRAGVWRNHVRKRGSIVVASMEALTCEKEQKTAVNIDAGQKQPHKSSIDQSLSETQRTRSSRNHQSNRLLRREKERLVREQVRERRIVTRLLATRVSPSIGGQSGGTGLRKTVTTSALQDWSSTQMKTEPGNGGTKTSQHQLTSVTDNRSIDRKIDDGILLVVPVRIQGREYRALVDSGATRSFISPACVTETGLKTRKKNAFFGIGKWV